MPIRLCLEPRCPHPSTYRGRCPTHNRGPGGWQARTHKNKHVYNSKRWRILRRKRLFLDPLCPCGALATDVDHIRPIEHDGEPYSLANTQSLCRSCHGTKTRAEQIGQAA